jgi:hypothetical protein
MQSFSIAVVLLLASLCSYSQSFEGRITYSNIYQSKIPNVSDEQLSQMMGSKQDFYIKGGKYKSIVNGTSLEFLLYLPESNKLYTKMPESDVLLWGDASKNNDEIISTVTNKNADTVLGFICDEVILKCKSGVQKYYFNSQFSVDAKVYALHKAANWAAFLSVAGALPLKMILETGQFVFEGTAISYKQESIADEVFKLPADAKMIESPY